MGLKIFIVCVKVLFYLFAIQDQFREVQGGLLKDQLLLLSKKANQETAFNLCSESNLVLVKIQDADSDKTVYDFAKNNGVSNYWIDANDKSTENEWVYGNGRNMTYRNWRTNQPDNMGNEDCASGCVADNGKWNDTSCNDQLSVICYKENLPPPLRKEQLILLPKTVNQETAFKLCKENDLDLLKILDEESNSVVYQFASSKNIGYYWIDANDKRSEGEWEYDDGTKVVYKNFNSGQPDNYGNEDCVAGYYWPYGKWSDMSCTYQYNVICYLKTLPASLNKTNLYLSRKTATQETALSYCKQKNMSLVKIQDGDSDKVVYEFAKENGLQSYWIDANDKSVENDWRYNDGHMVIYRNWQYSEPDNFKNEDCVHGLVEEYGRWNDIGCNNILPVICFGDTAAQSILKREQLVVLTNRATQEVAFTMCSERNLKLVKIQDPESERNVLSLARENGTYPFWIDANDKKTENEWQYNDGSNVTYRNWQGGQPDNYYNEDCVYIDYWSGKWYDTSCSYENFVICYTPTLPATLEKDQLVLLPKPTSHEKAIYLCNLRKMNLVKIQDPESDKIVYQFAKENGIQYYWIDANDKETEKEWQYNDGSTVIYRNWQYGQPDNYNVENCAHGSVPENGKWNDAKCCNELYVICYADQICDE